MTPAAPGERPTCGTNPIDLMAEPGRVTWHCSDEDSGPDVGLTVGFGDDRFLWAGEITRDRHAADECGRLGPDTGWWIILYGPTEADTTVVGKCLDEDAARALIDTLARPLLLARPTPTAAETHEDRHG